MNLPHRQPLLRLVALLAPVVCLLVLGGCQNAAPAAAAAGGSGDVAAAPVATMPAVVDTRYRTDVLALTSPDFVERAKASERLVAGGTAALPALGEAGDQEVVVHGEARVSTTRPVIQAILQDAAADQVVTKLRSPYPVVRLGAAEEIGQRGRWKPIPELIVRLDDASPAVRAASAAALRRLTNNFFGYSAQADGRRRGEAVSRWKAWWTQEGRLHDSRPDSAAGLATRR